MSTTAIGRSAEYILPLRWTGDSELPDLAAYLELLSGWIPVTVVDGSSPELFERHRAAFPAAVRHLRPEPGGSDGSNARGNGKVAGVMTGVRSSMAELLVIADDDVRYTCESLTAIIAHLESADVVRPQNYFDPLPWHAWWDTSRTLINRAWSADFPGTLAVRRSALLATGGYDPVLFENLELIRTVKAAGGREKILPGLFVARRPPAFRHFLKQRIRQAYDDFAEPRRLATELSLLPVFAAASCLPARYRGPALLGLAAAPVIMAGVGRRRHHGNFFFPLRAVWCAPLWALERAVCIWIALAFRLTGGMPYMGSRLKAAAHPQSELQRRHSGKIAVLRQPNVQTPAHNPRQEQP
ncbi:glycosyltransferase [Pseudarthrobacter sp. NPDC058329]|uniref:glycosyltransferase n=1 Tax=Pseudarthrobacter sp. NPDC058329 TaxID=3346448 RepID=UPI0036DC44AD